MNDAPAPKAGLPPQPGVAVLGYGFRPFFLAAGLWALFALALWLAFLASSLSLPTTFSMAEWHRHEMLFGFAGAAVAGFLLTAVPNWTGRLPLTGRPLLALVVLWLAARLAVLASAWIGPGIAALLDTGFLFMLLVLVTRDLIVSSNWRNLPMTVALGLFMVGCAASHAEAAGLSVPPGLGWRIGVAVLVTLITLIGGRIIPAFTRNWLAQRKASELPAAAGVLDVLTIAVTLAALVLWTAASGRGVAVLLALAAVLNGARLIRWQGWQTRAEPLLWVLHLGYVWVPVGLALLAIAEVWTGLPASGAVHGLTTGAIGLMILAVMTRATLGHTGRGLHAGIATATAYLLVAASALARLVASLLPSAYVPLLHLSATTWLAGYAIFLAVYGPMLLRPRVDGRPG